MTRKKKGGRLEKLGAKIREILKRIESLEHYNINNDLSDDIIGNARYLGIMKSFINYKLNNTRLDDTPPLDNWINHLNSIYSRGQTQNLAEIEKDILRDANIPIPVNNITLGGRKNKRKNKRKKTKRRKTKRRKTKRRKTRKKIL